MKHIEISKVLSLTKANKYEVACASFDVVDHIFKLEIPRSLRGRKLSVQAISLLSDGQVNYGYEPEKAADEEPVETAEVEAAVEAEPAPEE